MLLLYLAKRNVLRGVTQQARSQRGGDMGECPPHPSWIKRNFLAPEFQTDDCLSTGHMPARRCN